MIINIFMWSFSSNVISQSRQCWRSFFEDPRFLSSPSPPQGLPIYVENMVFFATQPSLLVLWNTKYYDQRVVDFIELEADSCSGYITSSNDG